MRPSVLALTTILLGASLPGPSLPAADDRSAADQKRGWKILTQAREAAGAGPSGEPLLDYVFHLNTKTEAQGRPVEIQSQVFFLHPHYVRNEISTPNGHVVMIYDGAKAFQLLSDDIRPLPPGSVRQFEADLARSHVLLNPLPPPETVRFLRRDEVEGRDVDVIEIDDVAGTPLQLFVDAETRDVLKKTFLGETPTGMARVEELYSDFRDIDGYRWHHHKRVYRNKELALEATTSDLRINTGLRKGDIIH